MLLGAGADRTGGVRGRAQDYTRALKAEDMAGVLECLEPLDEAAARADSLTKVVAFSSFLRMGHPSSQSER